MIQAAITTVGCVLAGVAVLGLLVFRRRWRRTVQALGTALTTMALVAGVTAATFDADRLSQPHFTGLLSRAPYITGSAASMLHRLESYRSGLEDMVRGVTALYATSEDLPILPARDRGQVVTVLHVSDIHLNPLAYDLVDRLVAEFGVDVATPVISIWD